MQSRMQYAFRLIKPHAQKTRHFFGIMYHMKKEEKLDLKTFLIVVIVALVLIALSYIAYYKFHLLAK